MAGERLLQHPARGPAPRPRSTSSVLRPRQVVTRAAASTDPAARRGRGRSRAAGVCPPTTVPGVGRRQRLAPRPRPPSAAPSSLAKSYSAGAVGSVVAPRVSAGAVAATLDSVDMSWHAPAWPCASAGPAPTATPRPHRDRDPPQRGPRGDEDAGQEHGERAGRPPRPSAMSWRNGSPATAPIHPPASSTSDGVDDDVPRTTGQVEQAEHGQRGHADAERQPPTGARCCPSTSSATPPATSASGQHEPAEAHEARRARCRRHSPTGPATLQVHGQAEQHAHHDEDQARAGPPGAGRRAPRTAADRDERRAAAAGGGVHEPRGGVLVALARPGRALGRVARLAMAPTVAMGRANVRASDRGVEPAQASITTGTIIGPALGALADELAGRPAHLPLEALHVAHALAERRLHGLGHAVAGLVEQILGLGRVDPAPGDDLRAGEHPAGSDVDGGDDHDDALLGQHPPVPQHAPAHIADDAVDVEVAGRHPPDRAPDRRRTA